MKRIRSLFALIGPRRLRSEIALGFGLLLLAGGGTTTAIVAVSLDATLVGAARERGSIVAELLAAQIEAPLGDGDLKTAKLLLESESEHMAYVLWDSPDGLYYAGAGGAEAPPELGDPGALTQGKPFRIGGDTVMDAAAPVMGGKQGVVHVGVSMAEVHHTTLIVAEQVLLTVAVGLLLGVGGIFMLAEFITRPLQGLMEGTARISRGELEVEIPVEGRDELAELSGRFNEMARQIREREAESARLRGYFEGILDEMPAGVIACDADGRIEYANRFIHQIFGAVVGRPATEVFDDVRALETGFTDPADAESVRSPYERAGRHYEFSIRVLTPDRGERSAIVTLVDVTRIRQLARHLQRAERLATAGEMSAGIVHAINNPLDGARRAVELARRNPEDEERVREMLEIAYEGTTRIAEVTRSLLDYARAHEARSLIHISPVDLVEEAVTLVRLRAEERGVALRLDLEEDLPEVEVDAGSVRDALVNILLNGVDACESGDEVVVRVEQDAHGMLRFTIDDSGSGIPPGVLDHIFEPFFTTKEFGKGTGLGLSMARRLIEAAGGGIEVTSTPGEGSRFVLTLRTDEAIPGAGLRGSRRSAR